MIYMTLVMIYWEKNQFLKTRQFICVHILADVSRQDVLLMTEAIVKSSQKKL